MVEKKTEDRVAGPVKDPEPESAAEPETRPRAKPGPKPKPRPEPVDDGFPKRIAPTVWVIQDGSRFHDLGRARQAAARFRAR